MSNEFKLVGPIYGTKKLNEYKNPDILYSIVDGKKCLINDLHISKEKNGSIYLYHSFYKVNAEKTKIIHTGRWYDNSGKIKFTINKKLKTLTVILKNISWENWDATSSIYTRFPKHENLNTFSVNSLFVFLNSSYISSLFVFYV